MWAVGPTAFELAARAVDDDRGQNEHHARDDDQMDDVIAALVARVVAGCSSQKREALYR